MPVLRRITGPPAIITRTLVCSLLLSACPTELPLLELNVERCGDGVVQNPERCDDGNDDNSDSCTTNCLPAACTDGFVQADEACDDGNINDRDRCTNACVEARCGDGIWRQDLDAQSEDFEACDDGNTDNNDACTIRCAPPRCGDGLSQTNEACDDGNTNDADACRNTCELARCGDGVTRSDLSLEQPGYEDCDGGENCSENCRAMICGNGVQEGSETCDDGNTDTSDACIACALAVCGDGFVRAGAEACDDGNLDPGDACSVDCRLDDHGDEIATATPITAGETVQSGLSVSVASAHLASTSDRDLFVFQATQPGVYRFGIEHITVGNPTCRIFDQNGALSGYADDHSDDDRDCSVEIYLEPEQSTYVEVSTAMNQAFDYRVTLQEPCGNGVRDAGEDCDPNDPASGAYRCRQDCRTRRSIVLAGTTGCAIVDGGVQCWGSNAGLILGGNIPAENTIRCSKVGQRDNGFNIGYDWISPDPYDIEVDVARFPITVVSADNRVIDLSGGPREAICAVYQTDGQGYCWGRFGKDPFYNNPALRDHLMDWQLCGDDLPPVQPDDNPNHWLNGACLPAPHPYAQPPYEQGDFTHFVDLKGITVGGANQCLIDGQSIWCWGKGKEGELGFAFPESWAGVEGFRWPVQPPNLNQLNGEFVAIGGQTVCAIVNSGRVACWGRNDYSQTGSGRAVSHWTCAGACETSPFLIPEEQLSGIVALSLGAHHACAVNHQRQLFCWGLTEHDQTGLTPDQTRCAGQPCVRLPTRLDHLPGVIDVATGDKHTCALMQDGLINCWGDNSKGQLGMGVIGPIRAGGASHAREPMRVGRLTTMIALTTSADSNCARNQSGQISCWGANETGQLGAGTCTDHEPLPLQVSLGE